MEEGIFGILMVIVITLGAFIMVIYLRKFENIERMAMIEKGASPDLFNIRKQRNTSFPLRVSLLFIGAGLGLLMGYFLDRTFDMDEVAYFSMLFIFGGLGLGAAYLVEEKKLNQVK
jgi:F0F1-type ATP synthase assembly protein I